MHEYSYLAPNWLALKINNQEVANHLQLFRGKVYDLGCGLRPYEPDILKNADQYIGIDWSSTVHELRADIVADLNKPLPVHDGAADTVVSFQVLEHLCEPQNMLNEACRILRPEGRIMLTVPFQWWVHEAPHDFYRYTRHGLEYMFSKAGFTDIEVREATGFWAMWFLKLNYQTAKLIRGPAPLRWLVRGCLLPLWLFDQLLAVALDRYWNAPQETGGYVVTARKP